jgi:cytidylate kinase
MKKPFLIVIDGPMGSGKTTVSLELHKKLKRTAVISLDRVKKLLSDYRPGNHDDLDLASRVGRAMVKEYLKNNINVIVEKAFTSKRFLDSFIKGFNLSARVFVYQLDAPLDVRILRIRDRESKNPDYIPQTLEKINRNSKHFEEGRYKKAKVFESHKMSSVEIAGKIMRDVK